MLKQSRKICLNHNQRSKKKKVTLGHKECFLNTSENFYESFLTSFNFRHSEMEHGVFYYTKSITQNQNII